MIEQLGRELANYCKIEPVLWERQPLKANHHFQNPVNIPAPHTTDIAIVILWLRLGVFLPAPTFLGAKTGRVVTGTEWEFEDAFNANQEQGAPELLVYRKTAASLVIVGDESEQRNIQKKLVDDFIARWFVNKDDGNFRAASHCFSGPTEFEEMLYTHLRALLLQRIGNPADLNSVHWHKGSPFRGLESFDTEHAQIFFGRRRIRNDIRDAIYQQIKLGRSILMVMGASGSGKSSLVKAGLIPDLMLPGMLPNVGLVRWVVMRPKGEPMTALHNALLASTALPELAQSLSQLINAAPPQLAVIVSDGLAAVSRAAQLAEPWVSRLILVVDQFEEIFDTTINSEVRDAFIASLAALALKGDVLIIATMRSDFYPLLEQMPALVSITAGPGRFLLLPPDDAEIGEIILGPAQEAGLVFETQPETQGALNEKLRQDAAAEPGILPLLEFTLYKAVFSPDGSKLAIVDFNYTVHLLNAKTMAELLVMKGSHAGYIRSIAFSGAGHRLITASED
ncbi:AAA family ATPase [Methylomonas paludis]|uniref:AAA family ATPase n=1 Tax=Methylomonas paludis TaxID=1173101 RepID=A0A975MRX0_9GAMM|nr:NACHT and WD repeat domain-containing protein [Methylomonas paludis]QWF72416.1 AAA family ATPase [Methylomonas paludis]